MNLLDPVMVQLDKLWATVRGMPTVRWATVTQASPLRIQLDGETTPMLISPQTTVQGLTSGERVICVEQNRRIIVLNRAGTSRPLPEPIYAFGSDLGTVGSAASAWENVPTVAITITPPAPLRVRAEFSAQIATPDPAVYGMIGVLASGGINIDPLTDPKSLQAAFHFAPFAASTSQTRVSGSKYFTVPAGVATTFQMQRRRNATSASPAVNYPLLTLYPIGWVTP